MAAETLVLNEVVKSSGKEKGKLFTRLEGLSKKDVEDALKSLNIFDFNLRDAFIFQLQTLIENTVYSSENIDSNSELQNDIVAKWNKAHEPAITNEVATIAIQELNLKYPASRKSFKYLSDGLIEDYKLLNGKPQLFVDLLFKVLICITPKKRFVEIISEVEIITCRIFNTIDETEIQQIVKRSNFSFRTRDKKFFPIMSTYHKEVKLEDLVYANGLLDILTNVLDGPQEDEALKSLKDKVEKIINKSTNLSEVNEKKSTLIPTQVEEENFKEKQIGFKEYQEHEKIGEHNILIESQKNSMDESEIVDKQIVEELKSSLASFQAALTKIEPILMNKTLGSVQEKSLSDKRLAVAEDEINRLNMMIKSERERSKKIENESYQKILKAVGSESSNYLLSDLFDESQGNVPENPHISSGRLINFFSALSMEIGLEEYSNGREMNEIFEVNKDELINNYHIDAPVRSSNETIQVQLLKYGWTIDGSIIIRPLVTEIKEED